MLHLLLNNQEFARGTHSVDGHILERLRKGLVTNRVINVEQSGPSISWFYAFTFPSLTLILPPCVQQGQLASQGREI